MERAAIEIQFCSHVVDVSRTGESSFAVVEAYTTLIDFATFSMKLIKVSTKTGVNY